MTAAIDQDQRYKMAADEYGSAIERLARGYEAHSERRCDLVQDIHFALWRSFASFDGRCSLRTWIYRVAHNTATSHVLKEQRRGVATWSSLDDDYPSQTRSVEETLHEQQAMEKLLALVQRLRLQDRQLILLYLEGVDAASMAEISGLKPSHIATKIHRIKALLGQQFHQESRHDR